MCKSPTGSILGPLHLHPLRFVIGHLKTVIDRYQNVHFNLVLMNSNHPYYDFDNVFRAPAEAFIQSSVLRKKCLIQCDLEVHVRGNGGQKLVARVKPFTTFETVTIDFQGKAEKRDFRQEAVADDDPDKYKKMFHKDRQEGMRQIENARLADVATMFRTLEWYLGKGETLDISEASELLHVRRLVFHPSITKRDQKARVQQERPAVVGF